MPLPPEAIKYQDIWKHKSEAKERALTAYQLARWQDANNEDSKQSWAEGDRWGMVGIEGELFAEANKLCEDMVKNHPEYFPTFSGKTQEEVVSLITAFLSLGLNDDATMGTIYELGTWERQNFTAALEARLKFPKQGL